MSGDGAANGDARGAMPADDVLSTISRILEILGYDPERKSFSVREYVIHHDLSNVVQFVNEVDPAGNVSLVYLASLCKKHLSQMSVNVLDLIEDPSIMDGYRELASILRSKIVSEARERLYRYASYVVARAGGSSLLGTEDEFMKTIEEAVEPVVTQFRKLHSEVYSKSGLAVDVAGLPVCRKILRFFSLAECVTSLERSQDSIAVCFISSPGTLDGYFGIFVKSGKDVFSLNERIDEAYAGQHCNMRNGRWAKYGKAIDLFPYEEACRFSGCDYKGLATSVDLEDGSPDLFGLNSEGASACVRIALAMAFVVLRFDGRVLDGEPVIIDSLLPRNLKAIEGGSALVKVGSAAVAAASSSFSVSLELPKIVNGEYSARFGMTMTKVARELTDAYGGDFSLDVGGLLDGGSSARLLGDGEAPVEFVGSRERMEKEAYYRARRSLAEHISWRMARDLDEFGGVDAFTKWIREAMLAVLPKMVALCRKCASDGTEGWGGCRRYESDGLSVTMRDFGRRGVYGVVSDLRMYLSDYDRSSSRYVCPLTGKAASVAFKFTFRTCGALEEFIGKELPKFCIGWGEHQSLSNGNSILDAVDSVGRIEGPLPRHIEKEFCLVLSRKALSSR